VGLILDSPLLIADEREDFDLAAWLRSRAPETRRHQCHHLF